MPVVVSDARWSADEKARIIAEATAPDARVGLLSNGGRQRPTPRASVGTGTMSAATVSALTNAGRSKPLPRSLRRCGTVTTCRTRQNYARY